MTINELLKEKGMSRYSLSKASGIPWATLSDICSGKTNLTRCNAQTLQKLSGALGMTIEDILALKVEPSESQKSGKPCDRSYLEINLSAHLQKAINDYMQGEKDRVSYMDCLWGELYGSINADLWSGIISEEQANYLRAKYLHGEEQEGRNDGFYSYKISYFDYISSLKNEDCNQALKRIAGRIDMDVLSKLVEETPTITEIQKDFYKVMLSERKKKILDYSMGLLLKQELS